MEPKLNIALVLFQFRSHGGYERQGYLLADEMSSRGHTVTVYSRQWPEMEGVCFNKVPNIPGPSWLRVLSFALFSAVMLKKNRDEYDLVIGLDRSLQMDLYRAGNACHKAWLAFRRKHEGVRGQLSIWLNPLHLVINAIEQRLFERIRREQGRVVVLSKAGMEQIVRYYDVPERYFSIIPPAIDFRRFADQMGQLFRERAREQFGYQQEEIVLLHVGSGFGIKGLDFTLHAVALLKERGCDVVLRVVGKRGRRSQKYLQLVEELAIEERVFFEGTQEDVGKYYASADIFVLPSLFETFSAAVIEALSFGVPVVVGEGAGVSSYVSEPELGRVVTSPSSGEEIANVIQQIIGDDSYRSLGGIEKRKQLAMMCERENVMDRYEDIFMEMVNASA